MREQEVVVEKGIQSDTTGSMLKDQKDNGKQNDENGSRVLPERLQLPLGKEGRGGHPGRVAA